MDDLQECARGNTTICDNRCVKTGNRQVPTTVQAEVTFIEQLPDVDLTETTAIQLTAKTFKYGSPTPVDYAAAGQSFVAKDTLVFAVAPASTTAFEDPAFALTCPEKYLAAYNPVSAECTTDKAREWTYKSRTDSDVDLLDETCAEALRATRFLAPPPHFIDAKLEEQQIAPFAGEEADHAHQRVLGDAPALIVRLRVPVKVLQVCIYKGMRIEVLVDHVGIHEREDQHHHQDQDNQAFGCHISKLLANLGRLHRRLLVVDLLPPTVHFVQLNDADHSHQANDTDDA